MIRLDKLLADNGLGTRKQVKKILRAKRIWVNGLVCTDGSKKIQIASDVLCIDGKKFTPRLFVYLMLNKPQGVVSSTADTRHKTVIDLLKKPWKAMNLHPIGRLDLDTEGLLILTNNGQLTHYLTSPKKGVPKTYYVELQNPIEESTFLYYQQALQKGLRLHTGYTCLPATLKLFDCEKKSSTQLIVTITEGKFHQVKKMFTALGNEVVYLKRISIGSLEIDKNLSPGEYRELTEQEIVLLQEPN